MGVALGGCGVYFADNDFIMRRSNIRKRIIPAENAGIIADEYQIHTLPNGIRIAHKQAPFTNIAHCGIMLDIGSRDELPSQEGLAHFWEHMAFKGTEKRRSHHIINGLETVGGELNAYTTKEKVCFHASVLDEHFDKAVDFISDITFHSVFPEKQLERERNVILEEMSMYLDSPEDAIQDEFDKLLFPDHSLGTNILGEVATVSGFKREDLLKFIGDNIDTERIVFSSVNRFPFSKVVRVASKYLAGIPHRTTSRKRKSPEGYRPEHQKVERSLTQAQCALGRPSYALSDERRLPFFMLVNLLGGPGMNSRFNMALREKYGFVYSIDANYTPYLDTGFFSIYFGTEQKHLERSIALVYKELTRLKQQPLTGMQLHHIKSQLMGQLAMSEESNLSYMLMMGKSLLDTDRVDSLSEIFAEINGTTAQQLQELAIDMFQEDFFSSLVYIPES